MFKRNKKNYCFTFNGPLWVGVAWGGGGGGGEWYKEQKECLKVFKIRAGIHQTSNKHLSIICLEIPGGWGPNCNVIMSI
jgi:hypothetical protein